MYEKFYIHAPRKRLIHYYTHAYRMYTYTYVHMYICTYVMWSREQLRVDVDDAIDVLASPTPLYLELSFLLVIAVGHLRL